MLLDIKPKAEHSETLNDLSNVYESLVMEHLMKVGGDLSPDAQADAA
jgi:hypothetical protein